MLDLDPAHDDLLKPTDPYVPGPEKGHAGWWIGLAVLVAAAGGVAAYFVYGRPAAPAPLPQAPALADTAPATARPLGAAAEPIVLPPLDQSDPLVRQLAKAIAAHPRAAAWLASNDLLRNFTLVVASVAEGRTPVRQLQMLRAPSRFSVIAGDGGLEIDPASYARYDGIAAAVAAIDPIGAARVYATLKPRIEEAYRDVGYPNTPFDQTLARALISLIETPALTDPVPVLAESRGIGFVFAAPKVEALTEAQKQLLRTGPRNTLLIQASLREIALALGVTLPARK